jgi:YD repeat-containing protein
MIEIASTLSTGKPVRYEYDPEGDLLEIVFRQTEATAAIELTESIILRFDLATSEPLSLSFIGFLRLIKPAKYGAPHFRLLADEWPDDLQGQVSAMLDAAPLNEFLQIGSYIPRRARRAIPLAVVKQPQAFPQFVSSQ